MFYTVCRSCKAFAANSYFLDEMDKTIKALWNDYSFFKVDGSLENWCDMLWCRTIGLQTFGCRTFASNLHRTEVWSHMFYDNMATCGAQAFVLFVKKRVLFQFSEQGRREILHERYIWKTNKYGYLGCMGHMDLHSGGRDSRISGRAGCDVEVKREHLSPRVRPCQAMMFPLAAFLNGLFPNAFTFSCSQPRCRNHAPKFFFYAHDFLLELMFAKICLQPRRFPCWPNKNFVFGKAVKLEQKPTSFRLLRQHKV